LAAEGRALRFGLVPVKIISVLENLPSLSEQEAPALAKIWGDIIEWDCWDNDLFATFCDVMCDILRRFPSVKTRRTVSKIAHFIVKRKPLAATIIWTHQFMGVLIAAVELVNEDNVKACPPQLFHLILNIVSIINPPELSELFDRISMLSFVYILLNGLDDTTEPCLELLHFFCLKDESIAHACEEIPFLMARKWNLLDPAYPLNRRICWLRFAHAMIFQLKLKLVQMLLDERLITIVTSFIEPDPEYALIDMPEHVAMGVHTISMMVEACGLSPVALLLLSDVTSALCDTECLLAWMNEMTNEDNRPDVPWTISVNGQMIDIHGHACLILEAVGLADTETSEAGPGW
jgi:hypothetical protein